MKAAPAASVSQPPSYRRVLAHPGFVPLVSGAALGRIAEQMAAVALVLLTLERYNSPGLAGLVVLLLLGPGVLISPIAGALLDRHGRIRLIALDYSLAAAALGLVVALDLAGALPAGLLCVLVTLGSLTSPLSNSGTRSLFPLVLPPELWDRANGIDSGGYVVAMVVGPAVAGGLSGLAGPRWAAAATVGVFGLAAFVVRRAPEPEVARRRGSLRAQARAGVVYVVRSPSLRGLALCMSVYNLGSGAVIVALPLLVLDRFGGGGGEVGLLFAAQGAGGLAGAALAGGFDSSGRERAYLGGGMLLSAAALGIVAAAPSPLVALAGMTLLGTSNGPIDIGLFGLRQRRTPVAWIGRVFAISMAFNFSGFPIGSVLGGVIGGASPRAAFGIAGVAAIAGAALAWGAIPATWQSEDAGGRARRERARE